MTFLLDLLDAILKGDFGIWLVSQVDAMGESILSSTTTHFEQAMTDICKPEYLSAVTGITIPIGILIMSIYFFIDLMSKSMAANFSAEILIRSFVKFVIGYALILNCDKLAGGIISFGDALVNDMVLQVTEHGFDYTYASNTKKILLYIQNNGLAFIVYGYQVVMNLLVKCLLELLMTALYKCMLMMVAYSRAISIFIYRAFLPIAVADIFGKGIYGGAGKHIKKILALSMQYPIVYIICLLSCVFLHSVDIMHTNWVALLGEMFMIFIVIVNSIKKSKDEAMQIFR